MASLAYVSSVLSAVSLATFSDVAKAPEPAVTTYPSAEVVVIGHHPTIDRVIKQTRELTAADAGQVPRFEVATCPNIYGLSSELAKATLARIDADISEAGLKVAPIGCQPDFVIFIAAGGSKFLHGLYKKSPRIFDNLELHARERLLAAQGPVWTWKLTSPRRRDGGPVQEISSLSLSDGKPPRPVSQGTYIASDVEQGRLVSPVRRDIDASFIVIEASRVDGLTVQQIADYCTMLGISSIDLKHVLDSRIDSILTLLSNQGKEYRAESELTRFDRAYLKSLYSGDTGYSFEQKTLKMSVQIDKALRATQ